MRLCRPLNYLALLGLVCVFNVTGCAHVQLQRISVKQANSVSDIYEQQVLDNLARFTVNPYATPSFSVPNQATNAVDDRGSLSLSDGIFKGKFWEHVSAGGEQSHTRNFTFNPVIDPNRLALMQCAYQRAVGLPQDECSKCCELIEAWTGKKDECISPCSVTCGWYCKSMNKRDIPKCCTKFGEYCGLYVWVAPGEQKEFSKLTNAIIDFASGTKAVVETPMKEVVFYLDSYGHFTPFGSQVQEIHAKVSENADESKIEELLSLQAKVFEIKREYGRNETMLEEVRKKKTQALNSDNSQPPQNDPDGSKWVPSRKGLVEANTWMSLKEEEKKDFDGFEKGLKRRQIELDSTLGSLRADAQLLFRQTTQTKPTIEFGPPTQFNGLYNGGLLQLRQRLDTIPSSRLGR